MSSSFKNLDVLRACAVLSVYLAHFLGSIGVPDLGPIRLQAIGQTGVLIFFVHTSLVLMLSMDRMEVGGAKLAAAFYVRRVFRIYPLSILAVLVVVILKAPRFPLTLNYEWLGWHAFVSNLALTQNLTRSQNFLLPLWSLPLEVQMYVFLPILFFLLKRYPSRWVPLAIWCLAVAVASWQLRHGTSDRLALGEYAPFFMAGVTAYVFSKYHCLRLPFWGWPLVIGVVYSARNFGLRSGWVACLLLGLAAPQFKELNHKGLKTVAAWIARYSYGIYLSHMVIFWYAFGVLGNRHVIVKASVCGVLSIMCPVFLYHAVEKPMIAKGVKWANRISTPPSLQTLGTPVSEVAAA